MAAFLRHLASGCSVVCARSIFRGSDRKLYLDGERRPSRNPCLVPLPAFALAFWLQAELLFTSNLSCSRVWNRLDGVYLPSRIPARSTCVTGFLVVGRSRPADVDGSLVLCSIRGHFPCRADTQSVARKGDPCCARRSAGGSGTLGCDSRAAESTLPVQRPAHAGRIGEISSKHGGRRDRATRRHAALHAERRWPRAGGILRGVRLHAPISCLRAA